jgi:hypothetical protein
MTDWKFGDVLKLTDQWVTDYNADEYKDLRVMFVAHAKDGSIFAADIAGRRRRATQTEMRKNKNAWQVADA